MTGSKGEVAASAEARRWHPLHGQSNSASRDVSDDPRTDNGHDERTMKAKLHSLTSEEVDFDDPADSARYRSVVHVTMLVGPDDGPGAEIFQVTVCTPTWLAEQARSLGPIVGRHLLIMDRMDVREAAKALRKHVERATGERWDDVAEQVARIGYWEFEDYQDTASGGR
jgi:hypothetical protein